MTVRHGMAGVALLAALALAGCATPAGGTPSGTAEPPPADQGATDVAAAWLDDGRAIGLVTHGSSTCVPTAGDSTADGQTVTVALTDPEGKACTQDLVPRATFVGVPDSVDTSAGVTVVATGAAEGTVQVGGAVGLSGTGTPTDYAPSAGWYSATGLVVLTWGSSTCVPTVQGVAATGEDALTLTFADFPADAVCTMDMVPRLVVVDAPAGPGDGDVTLTLEGGVSGTTTVLGHR